MKKEDIYLTLKTIALFFMYLIVGGTVGFIISFFENGDTLSVYFAIPSFVIGIFNLIYFVRISETERSNKKLKKASYKVLLLLAFFLFLFYLMVYYHCIRLVLFFIYLTLFILMLLLPQIIAMVKTYYKNDIVFKYTLLLFLFVFLTSWVNLSFI